MEEETIKEIPVTEQEITEARQIRAREAVNLIVLKRQEREEQPLEQFVDKNTEGLPQVLKFKVEEDYKRFENDGLSEGRLREEVEVSARKVREEYLEKNLNIPNKAFSKIETMSEIDKLFEREDLKAGDLKKIARVSFDVNGLKAVNDLNSGDHGLGDEYLKLSLEAIDNEELRNLSEELGFDRNFLVSRDGGDEFGVILKSENPIKDEDLEKFINKAQELLWNNEKVGRALDFNNPKVLANFVGCEINDVLSAGSTEEFKKKNNIPLDFKYRGAISAGASTIYESMLDDNNSKQKIDSKDSYNRIVQKMMGGLFGTSDRQMDVNKKSFKTILAEGKMGEALSDSQERNLANEYGLMLSRVYSRTEKEKELNEENQKLKRIEEARERHEKELDEYEEAGGSAEGRKELRDKHKKEIAILKSI